MKYFVIAGERSGDLHAAKLVEEIIQIDSESEIFAWGGDHLADSGANLLRHYKEFSVMGLSQVIKKLFVLKRIFNECKKQIIASKAERIILVDFPGFNLRIAKFAKNRNLDVYYYIPPKLWAWGAWRLATLKKYVDEVVVIFPFEVDWYKKRGVRAEYFGNPSVEMIEDRPKSDHQEDNQTTIALFPGSREQELKSSIPIFEEFIAMDNAENFNVAGVSNVSSDIYEPLKRFENVEIVYDSSISTLRNSKAAIVTSGTATLETALVGVPQIVCYRTSLLTYLAAKYLLNVKYISLVNILLKRELVCELLQSEFNAKRLSAELSRVLNDTGTILSGYAELKSLLSGKNPSVRIAQHISKER